MPGPSKLERRDLVLGALATVGSESWTPVQVQKLFFLLDRNVADRLGGPFFSFRAYDYGPFDADVYGEIEALERDGFAVTDRPPHGVRTFRLTDIGMSRGGQVLASLDAPVRSYVSELTAWLRALSFPALVAAVYRQYPEMKVNSVFKE